MKLKSFLVLLIIILAGLAYWRFGDKASGEVIDRDKTVEGDYEVPAGKKITIKKGAKLTVTGNLKIDGEIRSSDSDINLAVGHSMTLGKSAVIKADGNVLIGSSESLIASPEALYEEAGRDSGEGMRIGPFVSEGAPAAAAQIRQTAAAQTTHAGEAGFTLIQQARAAEPAEAVISGKIEVATPPPGVKRIVVLNFSNAAGIRIQDFELTGPDGRDGDSDKGASCAAKGKDGDDAMRFMAVAGKIKVNNFTLHLGSGGAGGDAETKNDCSPGTATGGRGGNSGNFKMVASGEFQIAGSFVVVPGNGGRGGGAKAYGKDGGTSENGGDATAAPGRGGDGKGCGSNGGSGGRGIAAGGRGGAAGLSVGGSAARTPEAQDLGGNGGNAGSHGGTGGNGGSCDPKGAGGAGAPGGSAKSTKGTGGIGATKNGTDGAIADETGGRGGNGGDGCGPGAGGAGGAGNPVGQNGIPGKKNCVATENQNSTAASAIKAIEYNGKYLPLDQLIIESEIGCGVAHYHAAAGYVKATDSSVVPDPGPQCGYGKVSEKPVMDVPQVAQ